MFSPETGSLGAVVLMGSALLSLAGPGKSGMSDPSAVGSAAIAEGPDLGTPLSAGDEKAIDITIMPDGEGLPPGSGNAVRGAVIFAAQCQSCHGEAGATGSGGVPPLTGGIGSITSAHPVKTVNSFWPYAPLVFDYVRRAMPPTAPQSLSSDEIYSVVAYILSVDGIVSRTATIDKAALARVRMPNRGGFVSAWSPQEPASASGAH